MATAAADLTKSLGPDGSLIAASIFAFIVGLAGIAFAITGVILFPYVPSTDAGYLLIGCSFVTCLAALLVLCNQSNVSKSRQKAANLCIVVQIAAAFSVLLITTESSFDFCSTKKPCWVDDFVTDDVKCDEDVRKNCDTDLSYLCSKMAGDGASVFLGNMNCDKRLENDCRKGNQYWGFEDRDDCMDFYRDMKLIRPTISMALVLSGGILQFVFSVILLLNLRSRL